MSRPLRVLIVEDSEDDAALLIRELKHGGYEPSCERVETPAAMSAALNAKTWDIIISDYVMPHFSGPKALELLQRAGLDLPFIMVSGKTGEDIAVEAMKLGAHDYIMKDRLARVVPAIERELRDAHTRLQNRQAEVEKRRFYRETILSVTDGKLEVCDADTISPYLANAQLTIDVTKPSEVHASRKEAERLCGRLGLEGERLGEFMLGVGEAITNAPKHGERGRVYAGNSDNEVWVAVEDKGPGIESLILPGVVLRRGFSTKPSLGLGYSLMLNVADRILLNTGPGGTTVVLIKYLHEEPVHPLSMIPDTWDSLPDAVE